MGVYIKGMEMPKNCWNCPFFHTSFLRISEDELLERHTCLRTGERTDENVTGYMKNCPLIELPPHGKLIDADAFRQAMYHETFETDSPMQKWDSGCWIRYKMFERMAETAPTIIPADGKED